MQQKQTRLEELNIKIGHCGSVHHGGERRIVETGGRQLGHDFQLLCGHNSRDQADEILVGQKCDANSQHREENDGSENGGCKLRLARAAQSTRAAHNISLEESKRALTAREAGVALIARVRHDYAI